MRRDELVECDVKPVRNGAQLVQITMKIILKKDYKKNFFLFFFNYYSLGRMMGNMLKVKIQYSMFESTYIYYQFLCINNL